MPIGPIIPHEVAVSPDGRLALTSEYGPNSNPGRHVILIDVATASIIGRIDLGPNSRPHTARFLPDGQHAVATMQDSDQLALLDLNSMQVVRTYPTGGREGHMVRLSPDGSRAYVTSRGAEGTLSVIFLNEETGACGHRDRAGCGRSLCDTRWQRGVGGESVGGVDLYYRYGVIRGGRDHRLPSPLQDGSRSVPMGARSCPTGAEVGLRSCSTCESSM